MTAREGESFEETRDRTAAEEHYFEHRAPVADERVDLRLDLGTIQARYQHDNSIGADDVRLLAGELQRTRESRDAALAAVRRVDEMVDREWPQLDTMRVVVAAYTAAQEAFERYQAADKAGGAPHKMMILSIQHVELRIAADRVLKAFRAAAAPTSLMPPLHSDPDMKPGTAVCFDPDQPANAVRIIDLEVFPVRHATECQFHYSGPCNCGLGTEAPRG